MALLASFLPTMMLSGFVFPIASMPAPIRAITYIVPARYFLVALRSIVLKGAGIAVFWPQLVALADLRGVHADDGVEAAEAGSGHSMRRVLFMMWKEVLELRQDPRIFSIIFIAPILQLTILGYAATTDVRNVPVVIVDADRSSGQPGARSAGSARSASSRIVDVVSSIGEVDPYLEGGRAWMALSIPPRYGENSRPGGPATLQIVADGSDASSTNIAMGYASNLIAGYAQDLVEQQRDRRRRRPRRIGAAASSRACASGSTRRSRAAISCCRASLRCCCSS